MVRHLKNFHSKQPHTQPKSLDDWCREASLCNLDYGTYRALIQAGKSFDDLHKLADRRNPQIHAHKHYNFKRSDSDDSQA